MVVGEPITVELDILDPSISAQYAMHIDYRNQWGLQAIRAADAYARLEARDGMDTVPGTGVRVAVIDTGVDLEHPGFDPDLLTETILPGAMDEDGSAESHGTAVTGIIGAARDSPASMLTTIGGVRPDTIHGVAWGAQIDIYAIAVSAPSVTEFTPITYAQLAGISQQFVGIFRRALENNPLAVNASFGVAGSIHNYEEERLRESMAPLLPVLTQADRGRDKSLIVFTAGNDNGRSCSSGVADCVSGGIQATSPSVFAGLANNIPELRENLVAVVAVDESGGITDFSNRCGIAAKWCLAAPGEDVTTTYFGGCVTGPLGVLCPGARAYIPRSGTSYAAPFVTGSLAVLAHWFRDQLANTELLARLYETASVAPDPVPAGSQCPQHLDTDGDRSACELSSTHGRGIIDLSAATAPRGPLRLNGALALSSYLWTGPAFGDLPTKLSTRELALFDDLGAPFWVPMGAFVAYAGAPRLDWRMARAFSGSAAARPVFSRGASRGRAGLWVNRLYTRADSHANLAAGGIQVGLTNNSGSLFAFTGPTGQAWGLGAAFQPGPLYLGAGWLREEEGLLGSTARGGLGSLSANTAFAGAGGTFHVEGWDISAAVELGLSAPSRSGVLGFSKLWTSAYALSALKHRLRLSVSQPLRVESGSARLRLPVGRTRAGKRLYAYEQYSLHPSGRQLDVSISWDQPLVIGTLLLEAVHAREPGHIRGRSDSALLAGYSLRF